MIDLHLMLTTRFSSASFEIGRRCGHDSTELEQEMRRSGLVLAGLTCILGIAGLVKTGIGEDKGEKKDNDKPKVRELSPVERARKRLKVIKPAALEAGTDRHALNRHLGRVRKAPNGAAEAREIEALVAWLKKHKVARYFSVTLGIRCTELPDEDLLALSSWSMAKLVLTGYVRAPIACWSEIEFKDPKNLLRLIPLAVPTEGGLRKKKR